jgi:hypothetical protein
MSGDPYVQSLLLLSRKELPLLDQLLEEQRRAAGSTGASISTSEERLEAGGLRAVQGAATIAADGSHHLADLSQNEPYWLEARFLRASLLQVLGNQVVVGELPAQLAFVLHCVCCGSGSSSLTWEWEVRGPLPSAGDGAEPVIAASAHPQALQLRKLGSLAMSAPTVITPGTATVRELVQYSMAEPGLYQVVVRLNGRDAGRLPLFVQLAPPRP